jgi:hypothetical protein
MQTAPKYNCKLRQQPIGPICFLFGPFRNLSPSWAGSVPYLGRSVSYLGPSEICPRVGPDLFPNLIKSVYSNGELILASRRPKMGPYMWRPHLAPNMAPFYAPISADVCGLLWYLFVEVRIWRTNFRRRWSRISGGDRSAVLPPRRGASGGESTQKISSMFRDVLEHSSDDAMSIVLNSVGEDWANRRGCLPVCFLMLARQPRYVLHNVLHTLRWTAT